MTLDRLGLIPRRLEARGELEVHTLLALMDSELWEGEGDPPLVEVLVDTTIEVPEDRPEIRRLYPGTHEDIDRATI